MRHEEGKTRLVDVIVAVVVLLIALAFLGNWHSASNEACKTKCRSHLEQIGRALANYYGNYNDFWPYFESTDAGRLWTEPRAIQPYLGTFTGALRQYCEDPRQQCPTDSLTLLYPEFLTNLAVFACPNTKDKPNVRYKQIVVNPDGADPQTNAQSTIRLWSVFGDDRLVPRPAPGKTVINPYGRANAGPYWSSYGYDHRVDHTRVKPNHVIMADMDETSLLTDSKTANHNDGANVMTLDGHVKWTRTPYASDNPLDHIYRAESRNGYPLWDPDTDSYVDRP